MDIKPTSEMSNKFLILKKTTPKYPHLKTKSSSLHFLVLCEKTILKITVVDTVSFISLHLFCQFLLMRFLMELFVLSDVKETGKGRKCGRSTCVNI
jgi:hypothetical protein